MGRKMGLFSIRSPRYTRISKNLAKQAGNFGDHEVAVSLLKSVLIIQRQLFPIDDVEVAEVLDALGSALMDKGGFEGAERNQREALRILQAKRGPEHTDTLTVRTGLSNTLIQRGRREEAESMLLEILALERRLGGSHASEIAHTLSLLGTLSNELGRRREAVSMLREALAGLLLLGGLDGEHDHKTEEIERFTGTPNHSSPCSGNRYRLYFPCRLCPR